MIAVGIGVLGIFLPLLPATPFFLISAACFARSSNRRYEWLLNHPWFGSYIRNYREHRGITQRARVTALVLLWGVIGYSALVVVGAVWLKGMLVGIATGVTVHLCRLRTMG